MLRVSTATAVTAVLAVLILILPRTFVLGSLSFLRPEEAPMIGNEIGGRELLEAGYPSELFVGNNDDIVAPVFALGVGPYRHNLAIAQGSDRGIEVGDIAVLPIVQRNPTPTLVGVVRDTASRSATVQTLSDPAWRTAVRIGTSSVDALLVGGLTPTLTLIAKGSPVAVGDPIISVDESLPYGMFIGTVAEVRDASDGVLREATIALPYALASLRGVQVMSHAR